MAARRRRQEHPGRHQGLPRCRTQLRQPVARAVVWDVLGVDDAKNIPADIKVYPDAGHSFANQLPGQSFLRITGFGYNEAATADAWSRVFAFFGEHLSAKAN
nr:dienelactone hydrolase family protein [Mycolicibacterium peregrinum]